jgi:hypothetical protein
MRRRLIRFLPVLVLLLLAVPTVLASVRVDDNGQVPFYARIERAGFHHNERWAVIPFYRDPACVPADFNLLDFFDFPDGVDGGAFDCQPPTTDNVTIWKNGPDVDFAPIRAIFHGLGAVPIWFVKVDELEAAVTDDVLTIGELEGLPSLMEGSARFYSETLRPGHSIRYNANGTLEDGRSFIVRVRGIGERQHVRIIFTR